MAGSTSCVWGNFLTGLKTSKRLCKIRAPNNAWADHLGTAHGWVHLRDLQPFTVDPILPI